MGPHIRRNRKQQGGEEVNQIRRRTAGVEGQSGQQYFAQYLGEAGELEMDRKVSGGETQQEIMT